MSAQRKYTNNYPQESNKKNGHVYPGDKIMAKALINRIKKLLETPEKQKIAAQIITDLLNK